MEPAKSLRMSAVVICRVAPVMLLKFFDWPLKLNTGFASRSQYDDFIVKARINDLSLETVYYMKSLLV